MAQVLKGTTVLVGFRSWSWTGFVPESVRVSYPNKNVQEVPDANGATQTKILMDPSTKISLDVIITTGSYDPPIHGEIVSLTPPKGAPVSFFVESAETTHIPGALKLSLEMVKEDSMSYTT